MGIGSFPSEFVRMSCVTFAFLLVLLQPIAAVSPRHLTYRDDAQNPSCRLDLYTDFSINVVARYKGRNVALKYLDVNDVVRMNGTCSKAGATVKLEFQPADAVYEIEFFPLKDNSFAFSSKQHHHPELRFRADALFPQLEAAQGYACFAGPDGEVGDSLFVRSYNPIPCDGKPQATIYDYFVAVNMDALKIEANSGKTLNSSGGRQSARGSVGVAIGVVLAVVVVVAIAVAVGLVVSRRSKAAEGASEGSSLVTLTLS